MRTVAVLLAAVVTLGHLSTAQGQGFDAQQAVKNAGAAYGSAPPVVHVPSVPAPEKRHEREVVICKTEKTWHGKEQVVCEKKPR